MKTNKVLGNVLQWADIKDPGVALTTLGVTDSEKEPV
jgi:hypothetical protein